MTNSLSVPTLNSPLTPFNPHLNKAPNSWNVRASNKLRLAKTGTDSRLIPRRPYQMIRSTQASSTGVIFFRFRPRAKKRTNSHQLKNVIQFTSLHLNQLQALLSLASSASINSRPLTSFYETCMCVHADLTTLGAGPTRFVNLKSRFITIVNPMLPANTATTLVGLPGTCRSWSSHFFALFQTYTAYITGPATGSVLSYSPEWYTFFKFAKQLSMRREISTMNLVRKAREKRYYSFYSYRLTPTKSRKYAMRTVLPKLSKTPRSSFWTTSNSSNSNLPNPLVRGYNSTSGATLALGKTSAPATSKSSVYIPAPRTRRKRKFTRFLRRSHNIVSYLLRKCKRAERLYTKRLRRFNRLARRRRVLFNRGAWKSIKRSSLLSYLPRATKSLKPRKSMLHFATQKAKHRAKGPFFKAHKLVRHKLRILSSPSYRPLTRAWLDRLTQQTPSPVRTRKAQIPTISRANAPRLGQSVTWSNSLVTFIRSNSFAEAPVFKFLLAQLTLNTSSRLDTTSFSPTHFQLQHLAFRLQNQIAAYGYLKEAKPLLLSNLWSTPKANYSIRRKLLRIVSSNLFSVDLSFWYYKTLTQFIENCSGRKSLLYFGPFVEKALTFEDQARCSLWNNRVTGFQRMMGHRIFVYEALSIVAMSIRLKDPTFLSNWIRGMLKRLSFWKYRLIFRYLKFLLQHVFRPNFHFFDFRGVKLRLKGKISVAGNARTRTLFLRVGDTSHSKANNRVAYDLSYIYTFTGVMGFKLWFFH